MLDTLFLLEYFSFTLRRCCSLLVVLSLFLYDADSLLLIHQSEVHVLLCSFCFPLLQHLSQFLTVELVQRSGSYLIVHAFRSPDVIVKSSRADLPLALVVSLTFDNFSRDLRVASTIRIRALRVLIFDYMPRVSSLLLRFLVLKNCVLQACAT